MAEYSSSLLSRLDLIYANSLNRFLVPMLRTEFEISSPSSLNTEGVNRVVTVQDFRKFMTLTGSRKEGYGMWTELRCADGTSPWEGPSTQQQQEFISNVFIEEEAATADSPVTGISWYDAFQYCRWSGGRLPTSYELTTIGSRTGVYRRQWSSSWYNEPSGLMAIVRAEESQRQKPDSPESVALAEGMNPDMRLKDLGFRIIYTDAATERSS
jgi:formylglycine-generating enzyme required for sulfatase activity